MSDRTTFFGPRVSFRTNLADPGPVHVQIPSGGTFTVAGQLVNTGQTNSSSTNTQTGYNVFTGNVNATSTSTVTLAGHTVSTSTVNLQSARLLSRATTASATSLIIADGEFAIAFQSVSSCRLVYRSGNTTYTWIATTGAVL